MINFPEAGGLEFFPAASFLFFQVGLVFSNSERRAVDMTCLRETPLLANDPVAPRRVIVLKRQPR